MLGSDSGYSWKMQPAAVWLGLSIFPTSQIPTACMDPVALNLMQLYMPQPNRPDGTYQGVPVSSDDQDQFTVRVDHRMNDNQNLTVYYYFLDESKFQPFDNFQARWRQCSRLWRYGESALSAVESQPCMDSQQRFGQRSSLHLFARRATDVSASAKYRGGTELLHRQCCRHSALTVIRILPQSTVYFIRKAIGTGQSGNHARPSVDRTRPAIYYVSGGAVIGNNWKGELPQVGNSFQWADNLSWVKGKHTMKFGADVRRSRFDQTLVLQRERDFTFSGAN